MTSDWLVLLVAQLPAIAIGVVAYLVLPGFVEVFDAFGAELPLVTRLMLNGYRWLLPLFPVSLLLIWVLSKPGRQRRVRVVLLAYSISLLLFALGIWAAYLPIFQLAQTQ